MSYNPNWLNLVRTTAKDTQTNLDQQPSRFLGRVVDIVLDEDHPDYLTEGRQLALNGIRYEPIGISKERTESDDYPFAYCLNTSIKDIPEVDEIVEIIPAPSDSSQVGGIVDKDYYRQVVNIWNNTNHNARPDKITSNDEAILGENVIENSEISNLTAFPGDFIIEGRHGNTLRFGGYTSEKNFLSDDSNNGKPFTILRVGVNTSDDSFLSHIENVERDYSSIYLMSDHRINSATIPSLKQDTYKEDDKPISINEFKGAQVLINSDRIALTADTDNILLNSVKSVGISSRSFNVDSSQYVTIDTPRINLGATANEPLVRGNELTKLLEVFSELLKKAGDSFNPILSSPNVDVRSLLSEVSENFYKLSEEIDKLNNSKNLLSKKTFTE